MRSYGAAVFLGGKVQHKICFRGCLASQFRTPEIIQIPVAVHGQPGLHLQPVGRHAVKGPEQAIKSGQNTQMLPYVGELVGLKHAGAMIMRIERPLSSANSDLSLLFEQPFHIAHIHQIHRFKLSLIKRGPVVEHTGQFLRLLQSVYLNEGRGDAAGLAICPDLLKTLNDKGTL